MTTVTYRTSPDMTLSAGPTASLFGMAKEILAVAEQSLLQLGLPLPARRFVYPSPVAVDCEQLAVVFSGWSVQPPLTESTSCSAFRWFGMFGVGISRPTPALQGSRSAPTVDAMEAAALLSSNDAEALLLVAAGFVELADISLQTPAPEGGYQTTSLSVMVPAFGGLG